MGDLAPAGACFEDLPPELVALVAEHLAGHGDADAMRALEACGRRCRAACGELRVQAAYVSSSLLLDRTRAPSSYMRVHRHMYAARGGYPVTVCDIVNDARAGFHVGGVTFQRMTTAPGVCKREDVALAALENLKVLGELRAFATGDAIFAALREGHVRAARFMADALLGHDGVFSPPIGVEGVHGANGWTTSICYLLGAAMVAVAAGGPRTARSAARAFLGRPDPLGPPDDGLVSRLIEIAMYNGLEAARLAVLEEAASFYGLDMAGLAARQLASTLAWRYSAAGMPLAGLQTLARAVAAAGTVRDGAEEDGVGIADLDSAWLPPSERSKFVDDILRAHGPLLALQTWGICLATHARPTAALITESFGSGELARVSEAYIACRGGISRSKQRSRQERQGFLLCALKELGAAAARVTVLDACAQQPDVLDEVVTALTLEFSGALGVRISGAACFADPAVADALWETLAAAPPATLVRFLSAATWQLRIDALSNASLRAAALGAAARVGDASAGYALVMGRAPPPVRLLAPARQWLAELSIALAPAFAGKPAPLGMLPRIASWLAAVPQLWGTARDAMKIDDQNWARILRHIASRLTDASYKQQADTVWAVYGHNLSDVGGGGRAWWACGGGPETPQDWALVMDLCRSRISRGCVQAQDLDLDLSV